MNQQQDQSPIVLLIASKNIHKIREIRTMLQIFKALDILSLLDFPNYIPPEETLNSFDENAKLKALDAAQKLNLWTIADDSGLVVPALNGMPGVCSARYAGNDATDRDNRKKLIEEMKHLLDQDRQAYFHCSLALSSPSGLKKLVSSTCEGLILDEEKGGGGFGYDPLFVKHEYSKTFSQLEESIKNRISHRRKALDKLLPSIESLILLN